MAAEPTDYYVDPAIAGDSGAGTTGDPYGDIQHALDTVTRDATDGDRLNIKAGTDEILAASLDLATYGTPTATAPLVLQGYTSSQGDGGIGGINNNSNSLFTPNSLDWIRLVDLHIHSAGSASIVDLDNGTIVINCEIDNTTSNGLNLDTDAVIINCHIHNCGAAGVTLSSNSWVVGNYFANGANDFVRAIQAGTNGTYLSNIISIDGASIGLDLTSTKCCIHNSVLSSSGTGKGITIGNNDIEQVYGNLIEGFSGAGGQGFDLDTLTTRPLHFYSYNAAYNNTTDYTTPHYVTLGATDNEALGASPFDKSGSDTFANRFVYFSPVDTGNVQGGLPNGQDKGAVQSAGGSGGGPGATIIGQSVTRAFNF